MTEADLLIKSANIVAFDDAGTEIPDGSIAINGNSITWIGPSTESVNAFAPKRPSTPAA